MSHTHIYHIHINTSHTLTCTQMHLCRRTCLYIYTHAQCELSCRLIGRRSSQGHSCLRSCFAFPSHPSSFSHKCVGLSVTVEQFVRMENHTDDVDKPGDEGHPTSFAAARSAAVEQFLNSPWYRRVALLVRAMHPWITMQFLSLFRSHAVRASLIILKLVSAAAANAFFFISTSTTPDSDFDCRVPQNLGERILHTAVVGILSACMGDLLILFLAIVQRRTVLVRNVWTKKAKAWQLRRWRCRNHLFWLLWPLADFQNVHTGCSSRSVCEAQISVSPSSRSSCSAEVRGCEYLSDVCLGVPGECE